MFKQLSLPSKINSNPDLPAAFIPFMILQINTSLSKMDKSLLEASSDLGANRYQTF